MPPYRGSAEYAPAPELLRLEELIRQEIPITRHLHFALLKCGAEGLVLGAPLQPNVNHKGTAFGGSIGMLSTLAGWGMVQLLLGEAGRGGAEVVIQKSSISYLEPVRGDFIVVCERPEAGALQAFRQMITRKGRARLHVRCRVEERSRVAATFEGSYVAAVQPAAKSLPAPGPDPMNRS